MADVTIRFRYNPKTGKRELIIGYESDSDALPHEHERDHRALAEALLGQPLGDDIENVRVERVSKEAETSDTAPESTPAREAQKVSQG
jgi:hypothetical protein